MPSHFKYRIKKTSENTKSVLDYDSIPSEIRSDLTEKGFYSEEDKNITAGTCAFIHKVMDGRPRYLCGIRLWTSRIDLRASDDSRTSSCSVDGSGEKRVSGSLLLAPSEKDKYFYSTHMRCQYVEESTAKTLKEGVADDETTLFPMCNCYSPRGGMAVTHFDGAVKASEVPGYTSEPGKLPVSYDTWQAAGGKADPNYNAPIPKYVTKYAKAKFPIHPEKLGFIFLMLNARALVASCCWWKRKTPLIYRAEYFRIIDLAVAQESVKNGGSDDISKDQLKFSTTANKSNVAEYVYKEGDYYDPLTPDGYLKNILLGRNYDYTLPECGNNQRLIYVLDSSMTGELVESACSDDVDCQNFPNIPLHYDSHKLWFSPCNCAHPDCLVRYRWGSVCNGGGGFDLAEGKACPYYENPLLGAESDRENAKLAKLSNMYPGDSITGGQILEMMWLCKGGLPWTKEEWEATWRVPYIWSTVPFSPRTIMTDEFEDEYGNIRRMKGGIFEKYQVWAVKTTVDLNTGKAQQDPPKLLPGGSITENKRTPGGNLTKGDQVPDLPTIVQQIELKPAGSINIIWPIPDFSLLSLSAENSEEYVKELRKLKSKSYTQLIWGSEGKNIAVLGYAGRGSYENGLYCINASFLVGDWKDKKDRLIEKIQNLDIFDKETQKLFKDLWRDLLDSQTAGSAQVLDGMQIQKTFLYNDGTFVFENIPLNLLYKTNFIIVFGFNTGGIVDIAFTKIEPKFVRGYIYQSDTNLMTGWKTVWNGRPSLFLNETSLRQYAGDAYGDSVGRTVDVSLPKDRVSTSPNRTGTESISDLADQAIALSKDIKTLNEKYSISKVDEDKKHYVQEITQKQDAIASIRSRIEELTGGQTSTTTVIASIDNEKARIRGLIQSKKKDLQVMQAKQSKATALGYNDLASFYAGLVAQINYDIQASQKDLEAFGPEQTTTTTDKTSEARDTIKWLVTVDTKKGDTDTNEGGNIIEDLDDYGQEKTEAQKEQEYYSTEVKKLYVPSLESERKYQKNIQNYKTILHENSTPEEINLTIPDDSGLTAWKYFQVAQEGVSDTIKPYWTYAPKGAKRVVVYSTKDLSSLLVATQTIKGVALTDTIGRWYTLPSCSSLIMLVMNPEICNRHNEFMIYSMSAEITYSWKGPAGITETSTKKIKFAPFNYSQVYRDFPGYEVGKTVEEVGSISKYGVTHTKISVSKDIEIKEKSEGNRHPWIFFAIACTESSDVKTWPTYNDGRWFPGGDITTTVLPKKKEDIKIYIEYAYIAEVYDQDDRRFLDWGKNSEDESKHNTRILFNHPKSGTIRSVFTIGDATTVGETVSNQNSFNVDGYSRVPIGSASSTALWPHARLACRDYEIHYIWRNNFKAKQVTDSFFMGKHEPRETTTFDKRYTYYTSGDHDLGTTYQPKITLFHWEGSGQDKGVQQDEMSSASNPTDSFPSAGATTNTPGNKGGPLYYPYTRSEPHSKFIALHGVYPWDFLASYRNKPKQNMYFGGFRMMASTCCYIGAQEQRNSLWETWYYVDQKHTTDYMGRSKTRGPLFQLEYNQYEEKKPRVIYLQPFVARNSGQSQSTWTYYATARTTKSEDWEPDPNTVKKDTTTKVADNPSDLTKGVWKALCRSLFNSWVNGDTSAYDELKKQKNWGQKYGWEVSYDNGLVFPDEQKQYTSSLPPDTTEEKKAFLQKRIDFYNDYIAYLEEQLSSVPDDTTMETKLKKDDLRDQIKKYTGLKDDLQQELDSITSAEAPDTGQGGETTESPTTPDEKEEIDVDLLTGCNKMTLQAAGNKGSFFFDDTYIPGSVTSSDWKEQMEQESQTIKEELQATSNRWYTYEQKSFGVNLPWSPFDSPPVFGNTGREMYIVELCTIGSIISWMPITDKTVGNSKSPNVPSWWTSREPEGTSREMVVLLPPPLECSRAIRTLSSEPQHPFYNYIFTDSFFGEESPDLTKEYKPVDFRIATKHSPDYYGQPYYRSDTGRLVLTLTSESKLANIKVLGDSSSTTDSSYISFSTSAVSTGNASNAQTPNAGDVAYDRSQIKNYINGIDVKGLALKSGSTTFVGQFFPGYYSPYTHGKVFTSYKDLKEFPEKQICWAWPKNNRDKLTRGISTIKWYTELPDLSSLTKGDPVVDVTSDYQLNSISSIQCAPYTQKHPAAEDGIDESLGPLLKRTARVEGDREFRYEDNTYYAIVVESARSKGGVLRPPLIWTQRIDNPDEVDISKFRVPKAGAVAYKILVDGTISAVTLGAEDKGEDTQFSSGYISTRPQIKNTTPGGNLITSDTMNAAAQYPAFEVGNISYRFIGKVKSDKTYSNYDLSKYQLGKIKNRYGYNNHLVETVLTIKNLDCDIMSMKLKYNDFFYSGIEKLFVNKSDGASVEVLMEGTPVTGSSELGVTKYYSSYLNVLPLTDPSDEKEIYYDLDFGMCKSLKITFHWYVRCSEADLDKGPWKGDDRKYDTKNKKWVEATENYTYLSALLDSLELNVLLAGKCAEVVKIEEAKFLVSTNKGSIRLEGDEETTTKSSYNFFTESKSEWYKCTWEESDKVIERNWDQKNLYEQTGAGDGATDSWARGGYETMVKSLNDSGLSYNKTPKSKAFPNSCVEIPELPQSRLKMEAWEKYCNKVDDRDWTWGGIWTTRIAGPEWKSGDRFPTRDFVWWPAPNYHAGTIFMKGRIWLFGHQYKDEAQVMAKKKEVNKKDKFNEFAYKNEVTGYDALLRNIQTFESDKATVKNSQATQDSSTASKVSSRKANNSNTSLFPPMSSNTSMPGVGSFLPGGGTLSTSADLRAGYASMATQAIAQGQAKNYIVNQRREFTYLDEVGLTPEVADWNVVKEREEQKQKELYEKAVSLKDEVFESDSIIATSIIPYYDWDSLMSLTGKEWEERNGKGDFSAITKDILIEIKDEDCTFRWKTWDWEEVESFTFRSELSQRYKPQGDLNSNGLLRRCGSRWKIDSGNPKAQENKFEQSIALLKNTIKPALEEELSTAKSDTTKSRLTSALGTINTGITTIETIRDKYVELGKLLWANYSTKMQSSGKSTNVPKAYQADPAIIAGLDDIIAKNITTYVKQVDDLNKAVKALDISGKEINKNLMKTMKALSDISYYMTQIDPRFLLVKQKMEYYKNVTEELVTYTRSLASDILTTLRSVKESKIIQVECHSEEDDIKPGNCDPEGYPQKWEWDVNRDKSQDWPNTVSDDGGSTIKRYDPWWRY
jgi:hypothetical protein